MNRVASFLVFLNIGPVLDIMGFCFHGTYIKVQFHIILFLLLCFDVGKVKFIAQLIE